jgi:hypothetical protein
LALVLVFAGVVLAPEVLALAFTGAVLAREVGALGLDAVATVFWAFTGGFLVVAFFRGLCTRCDLVPVFFAVVFALTFFVADFVAIKTCLPEKSKIQSHLGVGYGLLLEPSSKMRLSVHGGVVPPKRGTLIHLFEMGSIKSSVLINTIC